MTVTLLFFARYRDIAQADQQVRTVDAGSTVHDLVAVLTQDEPAWESALAVARFAVNAEFCDRSLALNDGDEVALMPPVSGGIFEGDGVR